LRLDHLPLLLDLAQGRHLFLIHDLLRGDVPGAAGKRRQPRAGLSTVNPSRPQKMSTIIEKGGAWL
jgi:hypothetical protein